MRRSKFKEEQLVAILRKPERAGIPAVAKRHKVGDQTVYIWKRRFETFQPDDILRG